MSKNEQEGILCLRVKEQLKAVQESCGLLANISRTKAVQDVADWIEGAMASGLFGSDSWGLRHRLADIIRSRDWEYDLANEEMKP